MQFDKLAMSTRLSVIIPTRNREHLLSKALDSIAQQSFPRDQFEVIVIDNGSSDNTKSVCTKMKGRFGSFQYLYDDRPGLHVGRHLGMQNAPSEILVFADDDIEAFPSWLAGIAIAFQDPSVVLVGGKNLPNFESKPPGWILDLWKGRPEGPRTISSLSILDLGEDRKEISPIWVYGCNFSIRKQTLLAANGFHPDAMPTNLTMFRGDGESHVSRYVRDQGFKTIYAPDASVYHWVPQNRMTVAYFSERAYKQGISDSFTLLRRYRRVFHQVILFKFAIKTIRSLVATRRFRTIRRAYLKGFWDHQTTARRNRELFNWVLKKSYFSE
jgi:glycosyltransferase involved in cell wall biosynthesis